MSKSDISDFDWERVGVRGYGLSLGRNPSPGSHLSMRSDLSHKGRGDIKRLGQSLQGATQRSNPFFLYAAGWIASRSLSSGAHSRDPLARNDDPLYAFAGTTSSARISPAHDGCCL